MRLFFILLLIPIILMSCSKQKKETALENCADSYFLDHRKRLYSIETNYENDPTYISTKNLIDDMEKSSDLLTDEINQLSIKYKKENPKPRDKSWTFKRPELTDPKYFQKNSNMVDFKLYDEALAKYEKNKEIAEEIYREKFWKWESKRNNILYKKKKERKDLDKKIKETQYELPRIIYSLVDKKFILLTLKDKSNISLYIDIYTGCESSYNETPSAFLLEWQNN